MEVNLPQKKISGKNLRIKLVVVLNIPNVQSGKVIGKVHIP